MYTLEIIVSISCQLSIDLSTNNFLDKKLMSVDGDNPSVWKKFLWNFLTIILGDFQGPSMVSHIMLLVPI